MSRSTEQWRGLSTTIPLFVRGRQPFEVCVPPNQLAVTMLSLAPSLVSLELTDLTRDQDHSRAILPNLVVAHWLSLTTLSAVQGLAELLPRATRLYPRGIGLIQVVSPHATMPSSEARAALAQMLRGGKQGIIGSSVVIGGEGFRVAAARAFVTGIGMLVQPPFPHLVHPSVAEAVAWLSGIFAKAGVGMNASALTRAVEALALFEPRD